MARSPAQHTLSPSVPIRASFAALCLFLLVLATLAMAVRPVVPAMMAAQRQTILACAERHGIAPDWLAAVLYNEMLGQEDRALRALLPGEEGLPKAWRDSLLSWHFLTLKQGQWAAKVLLALVGFDPTLGPTGIRVSVGREIRAEVTVEGGWYRPNGPAERPTMILDLMDMPTAIEYLAANLERGQIRLAAEGGIAEPDSSTSVWAASTRWHNTGLTTDRPDVPRWLWAKGSRYVDRVQSFLPAALALVGGAHVAERPGPGEHTSILKQEGGPGMVLLTSPLRPVTLLMGVQ